MISEEQWSSARQIVRRAAGSSMHCSIASVNADGSPHVTPIGSLMLGSRGAATYLDVFNTRLAANVDRDPNVAIIAVDSRQTMWLRSLLGGRFVVPPGIRLIGTVGAARPVTDEEIEKFYRFIGPLRRTRGGRAVWGSIDQARDVEVTRVQGLNMGPMTPLTGVRSRSAPSGIRA